MTEKVLNWISAGLVTLVVSGLVGLVGHYAWDSYGEGNCRQLAHMVSVAGAHPAAPFRYRGSCYVSVPRGVLSEKKAEEYLKSLLTESHK